MDRTPLVHYQIIFGRREAKVIAHAQALNVSHYDLGDWWSDGNYVVFV